MRNWDEQEIRARGFDPASGARLSRPGCESCGAPRWNIFTLCRPCYEAWAADQHDSMVGEQPSMAPLAVAHATSPPLSTTARSFLKPEQLLQVEVVETLRPKLVAGARLVAINGELPGGSKLFKLWQTVKRAAGYEPGLPDLQAMYHGQVYFLELKRPKGLPDLFGRKKPRGELSDVQRAWLAWAKAQGFPFAVCRSVAEVEAALKGWRLIAG